MSKKILYISNMYPSKKYKHYGIFVKNMEEDFLSLGYKIDKVIKKKQDNKIAKALSYTWFYIRVFFKSLLKKYDIIYVHFISHSAKTLIKKRAFLILHAHGNDIVPDYKSDLKNKVASKSILKKADKVVVPSSYFKEVLIREYKIKEEIIKIYPSGGIHFDIMKPLEKEKCLKKLNLNRDYQYLGYISRIEKDKGWDTLLEAIYLLKKEKKWNHKKLLMVGCGEEEPLLAKKIEKYHLEEEIIKREFVSQDQLVYYYNALEAFIFPTKRKSESLGLVGLEAMACKIPLIVCTLYGPKTYATKENAITYENATGEELKNKIEEFFNMGKEEKEKMIENAYATAKEYDSKRLLGKLEEIVK